MQQHFLTLALLVSLGTAAPSFATEPGTPMDCSDLELAPGLTCTAFATPGEGTFRGSTAAIVDNEGRLVTNGDGSNSERERCARR